MAYVDGFLLALPKDRVDEYKEIATKANELWREHGALEYKECVGDDVPDGEVTSFPMSVKAKDDEVVVFAYIRYESREHRDEVNAKVMADERMKSVGEMPFDMQRMMWGGFEVLVDG
jgi:uncharacterized protein YbaA (DUF1428 family)